MASSRTNAIFAASAFIFLFVGSIALVLVTNLAEEEHAQGYFCVTYQKFASQNLREAKIREAKV